jgi:hypothetical protein
MNKSIAKVAGIFMVVCLMGCESNSAKPQQKNTVQNKIAVEDSSKNIEVAAEDSSKGVEVALTFIDDYVKRCNEINKQEGTDEWIELNLLVSKNFIYAWQTILNNSYREDAEMGLDFDPIFDAQDWPEEGFELESFNTLTGYYVVRGKKWKEFRLAMKIINENGECLVDGCGIVNIPYKYRIKR